MKLGLSAGLRPGGTELDLVGIPDTNQITFKYGIYLAATGSGSEAFDNWSMLPRGTRAAVVALAQLALTASEESIVFAPNIAA